MTINEVLILFWGCGFLLLSCLLLVNAIYVYRTYYPEISRKIDGETFEGGFPFAALRFMHWGHFCISRKRAKKFGVEKVFYGLPKKARFQLIVHWVGMLFGGGLLFIGWLILPAG